MYKLNPDKEKVKKVREALKVNNYYCPCVLIQDENTKCPCKQMREKQKCICGLYIKE